MNRSIKKLSVMLDLEGCPNHCRHCWLGERKKGKLSIEDLIWTANAFKGWRDEWGVGIEELGFHTWWREPDYRNDYRKLWELERNLSDPGCAQRFELLSTWRLARDPEYAHWAATLPTKACQITFFGLEENTDWGMRRRGAFRDQLLATQRCIEARIVPRWQLFITKRCLHELDDFLRLIDTLELQRSLEAVGQSFEVFIGGMSPEGSGYEIDPLRPAEEDLRFIPQALTSMARDGTAMLGKPEYMLLDALKDSELPPNLSAGINGLFVDPGFHVYPNLAEPAEWWRLGNLKTDGVDAVMKSYLHETTPGMRMNRTITVGELARRYGNRNSRKLYHEDDLICRFVHQWGLDITGGENDA